MYTKTVIIRHRRENLKKCSLHGLESRDDLLFYTYPQQKDAIGNLSSYVMLSLDGPELSKEDAAKGLVIVDGTWRLAEKIVENTAALGVCEKRSLPRSLVTAYPRRQDPDSGLASIEALYAALFMMGRDVSGLLDHYHWKELFLKSNKEFFTSRGNFSILSDFIP